MRVETKGTIETVSYELLCDYCKEKSTERCYICYCDICKDHSLGITIEGNDYCLCPTCASLKDKYFYLFTKGCQEIDAICAQLGEKRKEVESILDNWKKESKPSVS